MSKIFNVIAIFAASYAIASVHPPEDKPASARDAIAGSTPLVVEKQLPAESFSVATETAPAALAPPPALPPEPSQPEQRPVPVQPVAAYRPAVQPRYYQQPVYYGSCGPGGCGPVRRGLFGRRR